MKKNTALCWLVSEQLVKGTRFDVICSAALFCSRHGFQANFIRIDLTAANNVHIVEPHWNPMAEAQAVDRIHRIGQTRDVKVIRYIISDSIEKVSLACDWFQRSD